MPDVAAVEDTIAAVGEAVGADLANVTAAIDAAVADIDRQLAVLYERREQLEAALGAVNDQITVVEGHRDALIAARAQAPSRSGNGAQEATDGGSGAPAPAESDDGAQAADDGESAYLEFTEEELDPAVARTERILMVLRRGSQSMKAAEITDILNQFGDDTSAKVVSGTVSSLVRRGAVAKAGSGLYTAT